MNNKTSPLSRSTRVLLLFSVCAFILSGCSRETYSVTYDPNGTDSGFVPTDATSYENGMTVTVLDNTGNLVRAGYSFASWNTAADGSGTSYTTGNTFTMGSSHVTLYAQWGWSGIKQMGTTGTDNGQGVAVDSSENVYVTGSTNGALTGANAGGYDIFLTKYNSSGTQQWIRQIGTSSSDSASGVAVDPSGNVYVTGRTYGALTGANAGSGDIFLTNYNSSGDQQWIKQIGTSGWDEAYSVAVDSSGNVYVTGYTAGVLAGTNAGGRDIFLTKYDTGGAQQWIRQIGTSADDEASGVAVDSSGNAYVTGQTEGTFTGANAGWQDIFLTKYDTSGAQQWIKQIGTSAWDEAYGVALDSSGNAYVTGFTEVIPDDGESVGLRDTFLTKYNTSGTQQWIKQVGTSEHDTARGVAVDSSGNVYVTGSTEGAFTGANAGGYDIFLTKYNSSGTQQWIKQIGTLESDGARGVAVDSSGNEYVTGSTRGDLSGTNAGNYDVFLLKYDTNGNLQ